MLASGAATDPFASNTTPWRMSVARISGRPSPSMSPSVTFDTPGSCVSAPGKPTGSRLNRGEAGGEGQGSGGDSACGAWAS